MLNERELAAVETSLGCLSTAPRLAFEILGTNRPADVSRRLDAFCLYGLGSAVSEVLFCELSVGAAFGIRLQDGRRMLVKAHPRSRTPEYLLAVYRVQSHLFRAGFPCPGPAVPPAPFGAGFATVEDLVDDGEYADARIPGVRRASAGTLARLVRLAGWVPGVEALAQGWGRPAGGDLWPPPHSPLFDFGTAESAWIEGLATAARRVLDRDRDTAVVVGHADWCSKHLRFEGGEVTTVYDWDSLRLDSEPAIAGAAAATFPANRHLDAPNVPTPEETWLFIMDYEAARGRPFSRREREVAAAAAVYTLAYLARCEHAVDPAGAGRNEYRTALPQHAAAYFRTDA